MAIKAKDPSTPPSDAERGLLEIRRSIFDAALARGAAHVASSMSIVEILYCLYFQGLMRHDPADPEARHRDRLVLSKGHGALALYAVLAKAGFVEPAELASFAQPGTRLGGEPNRLECPGVEASTGSLGHGLSIGLGMALGAKIDDRDSNVFVILGDGECQEGSVWEAAGLAPRLGLSNLIAIVDDNGIQKEVPTSNVVGEDRLAEKWRAFGWDTCEADGHSLADLSEKLGRALRSEAPSALIAHTVKGKGIALMEGDAKWHYRMPRRREMPSVLADLGMKGGDHA